MDQLISLLAQRRNVSPRRLQAPGPDAAALHGIVAAAAHAPDHGCLLPWRFILLPDQRGHDLAAVFLDALVLRDPDCAEAAREQAWNRAFHAPCLLVAVLSDDPAQATVTKAEKLVSLGAAIQNMLIAAQALGFDSGLASGATLHLSAMRALLRLAPHEEAVCFIAFGTAAPKPARTRPQVAQFFSVL